jgi:tetratricopeptide (TPR) repeat protein
MAEHFGDLFKSYMLQAEQNPDRLERLTKVPKQTIVSWVNGAVKHPRQWQPIVKVAAALRLYESEANALLQAAGYPPLAELISEVEQSTDQTDLPLFDHWRQRPSIGPMPPISPPIAGNPPPFQVPRDVGNLIGRTQLIASVRTALLQPGAICLLHGMGGVGKSALAIHLAYTLRRHFPDGVLWGDLTHAVVQSQIDEAVLSGVVQLFAEAYGRTVSTLPTLAGRSAALREVLANKRALLILDNAEGPEASAALLPPSTSSCAVLITSRNRSTVADKAQLFPVLPLGEADGLALFSQLLGEPRVAATAESARQIVLLLGGLPLALKLVAGDLAFSQLTLADYHDLLTAQVAQADPQSDWAAVGRAMHTSFEVTYAHLPPDLQQLFALLWLFRGPDFSVEAVAAVAQLSMRSATHRLGQLDARSFVEIASRQAPTGAEGDNTQLPRYRLHPLLREFSFARFQATQLPLEEARQRAIHYFARFAADHQHTYEQLAREHGNILAALHWARQQKLWDAYSQGLAGLTSVNLGVIGYLDARGHWEEAQALLREALSGELLMAEPKRMAQVRFKLGAFAMRRASFAIAAEELTQSRLLLETMLNDDEAILYLAYTCERIAQLTFQQNPEQSEAALQWSARGISLLHRLQTPTARQEEGYLLIRQAAILAQSGQLAEAQAQTAEGLRLLPSRPTAARISGLTNLGILHTMLGHTGEAIACWQQALQDADALGDHRRLADLWSNIGAAETRQGRFLTAIAEKQKALQVYRQMGDVEGEARIQVNLGEDYLFVRNREQAQLHLAAALDLSRTYGLKQLELLALANQTQLALDEQRADDAELLVQTAAALSQTIGSPDQQAEVLRLRATVDGCRGRWLMALHNINRARKLCRDTRELGLIWRLCGDILSRAGKSLWSEQAFAQSRAVFAELSRFELARTHVAQAHHHLRYQTTTQAVEHLETALALMQGLDAATDQAEIITLLIPYRD